MHFQLKNKQTKFLYVVEGKILDVVVNLNRKSKNFGKVYKFTLKAGEIIFVPDNYAHGYECLSSKCTVLYHLERYRDAKNESGIMYNDKSLKIKWKTRKPILSFRDKNHHSFLEFKKKFFFYKLKKDFKNLIDLLIIFSKYKKYTKYLFWLFDILILFKSFR